MDAHPEVGLAYGRQIVFYTDQPLPQARPGPGPTLWKILTGPEFLEMTCGSGSNLVPTPAAVVRTRAQREVGHYRNELPHSADMEMWLRFAARTGVGVLDADQAFKRMHERNMQLQYIRPALGDLPERKATFDSFFEHEGRLVPDRERLMQLAFRSLGTEAFWAASAAFDRGDLVNCRECLGFADRTCPAIRSLAIWGRLRVKRAMGPSAWSFVRPILERVRGR
jgi:hypothetical protein